MRLRLRVQRHELPPTNILWSVPDASSSQAYTVARLLEDVNNIIPLEAEQWGLEDYVVEIGGFECLHFSPVFQTLKEDDQVSIRPLLTAEVRSRTLTGRVQISESGQHLVDGVPFGRPYLKRPNRPAIPIPPRKRLRLAEDATGDLVEPEFASLITVNGDKSLREESARNQHTITPSRQVSKAVHFEQLPPEQSDSEDDEDFAPDESDVSMEDDSTTDSDNRLQAPGNSATAHDTDDSSDASDSSSSSEYESESESDSESDSNSSSGENERSTPEILASHPGVPHGKGTKQTQQRNSRRRRTHKLRRLKYLGILDAHATYADLDNWYALNDEVRICQLQDAKRLLVEKKRKPTETNANVVVHGDQEELEQLRRQLLAKYGQDTPSLEPRAELAPPSTIPAEEPVRKRLRPNVSAITRIIGHQARPVIQKAAAFQSKAATNEEGDTPVDPKFWKSKINLSAFECWHEEVELSTPPFPFKQHWDPASKEMNQYGKPKSKRNKKTNLVNAVPIETPVKEEATVKLDYGEVVDLLASEKTEGNNAAIESQFFQDARAAVKTDLPPLPEDPESLPSLSIVDLTIGAVIVFKTWDLNNLSPEVSGFKTAIIEEICEDHIITLRLADRDVRCKEKKFDQSGNRIYERADQFQLEDSDDDEEPGVERKAFNELIEPKLLRPA
ncbi:hypothetical protein CC78DRAFT_620743 [Lojkania enalia]|uniref:DUF7357 domain-containing protein n=1 Tax=Lojkania enalia TaxID=147567 RepID=A0A9P4JYX7_9PLEO|nr:hypothetical protein CC78DRAFT_620743 [Didymosphaeria enalia]